MALSRHERTRHKPDINPLELIEKVVSANDWPFDRTLGRESPSRSRAAGAYYRMFLLLARRRGGAALHLRL